MALTMTLEPGDVDVKKGYGTKPNPFLTSDLTSRIGERQPKLRRQRARLCKIALDAMPNPRGVGLGPGGWSSEAVGQEASARIRTTANLITENAEQLLEEPLQAWLAKKRPKRAAGEKLEKLLPKLSLEELWLVVAPRLLPSQMSLLDADETTRQLLRLHADQSPETLTLLERLFLFFERDEAGCIDSRAHAVALAVLIVSLVHI